MQWIEYTKKVNHPVHGPDTPVVSKIKLSNMDSAVYFSTTGKAKVDDETANLLLNSVAEVQTTDSTNPGEVIGKIPGIESSEMYVTVPNGMFGHLDGLSADLNDLTTDALQVAGKEVHIQASAPSEQTDKQIWFPTE